MRVRKTAARPCAKRKLSRLKDAAKSPAYIIDPDEGHIRPKHLGLLLSALNIHTKKCLKEHRDEIVGCVDYVLNHHEGMVETLDRAPSVAHMHAELGILREHLHAVFCTLEGEMGDHSAIILDELLRRYPGEPTLEDINRTVSTLSLAVDEAIARLPKKGNRGAPSKKALRITIQELVKIFEIYQQHPSSMKVVTIQGYRQDFVEHALSAIGVPVTGNIVRRYLT